MSQFDDRQKSFEAKFVHDAELAFKANARRNKLLGLWAAEKLGLQGSAATDYAAEVVKSDFKEAGDHDVLEKVLADFVAKGVDVSEHQIRREMDDLMDTARQQIMTEVK